jgi:hypothetical protein
MALKPPGSRSNLQLLVTLAWTAAMLVGLIGGHVIIGWLILSPLIGGSGMKGVLGLTHLPAWGVWLWMLAALALDAWIVWHIRQERKEALRR